MTSAKNHPGIGNGKQNKWLRGLPHGIYTNARELLMTGPRAQEPTGRAIRKTIRRLERGDKNIGQTGHGWRSP